MGERGEEDMRDERRGRVYRRNEECERVWRGEKKRERTGDPTLLSDGGEREEGEPGSTYWLAMEGEGGGG